MAGQPIAQRAQQHDVSRKFICQQLDRAHQGISHAFAPTSEDDVLFSLPLTRVWLRQLVLALVLLGHSSVRGVVELLRDLFDYPLSVGTAHNILHEAVTRARTINRLLELQDRGFQPEATIADAGTGLRAGQKLALPHTPCRGDVFHAWQELEPVVSYLENRAYEAIAARSKLDHQQAQFQRRHGRSNQNLSQKLGYARAAEAQAITLADDVAVLVRWLRQDILAVAGPTCAERRVLYDFVLAELPGRAFLCPHRLGPVCTLLANQRDDLLAFAAQLDGDLEALAQEFEVPQTLVREVLNTQALEQRDRRRWQREAAVRQQLRHRFHGLSVAVAAVAWQTVRASSVIEDLNSRLRNYFFLRRHLGADYLALLQFFLNHHRLLRSESCRAGWPESRGVVDGPAPRALAGDARLHAVQAELT